MQFALSTRWNARRHRTGEAMVEEILGLGFQQIELGYDLTRDLAEGIRRMTDTRAVRVVSVHNYCPVPMGVPRGHPELWTLTDPDEDVRRRAVEHTTKTLRFAAEMGAGFVVVHGGYVRIKNRTRKLIRLAEAGRQGGFWWRWHRRRLDAAREKAAARHIDWLAAGLEQLLPVCEEVGVAIALENLPSWEAIPSEVEFEKLALRFNSPRLRYWHDFGHGQIRENLGFTNHFRLLEKLQPVLGGFHIHDVAAPAEDHVPPGRGMIDFSAFREFARLEIPRVIELSRAASADTVRGAVDHLRAQWESPPVDAARGSFYG